MGRLETIRTILSLSSGTVARLCGSPNYNDIEEYTLVWVEWVAEQPTNNEWATWQECHDEFKAR